MFDEQIVTNGEEPKKGTNILLVPRDAVIPDDITLPVFDWTWDGVTTVFKGEELPAILRADANDDQLVLALARFQEITLKTLQGLPTDYPSHWQITFSALPKLAYQELLLAKQNSKAHDGSGVQPEKIAKPEMKPLDPRLHNKLSKMAEEEWASDDVDR